MKIKIISSTSPTILEDKVNAFIETIESDSPLLPSNVIDVKLSTPNYTDAESEKIDYEFFALIMYRDILEDKGGSYVNTSN